MLSVLVCYHLDQYYIQVVILLALLYDILGYNLVETLSQKFVKRWF